MENDRWIDAVLANRPTTSNHLLGDLSNRQ
jgi:hypothetical protein